jgi:hypothetical protein
MGSFICLSSAAGLCPIFLTGRVSPCGRRKPDLPELCHLGVDRTLPYRVHASGVPGKTAALSVFGRHFPAPAPEGRNARLLRRIVRRASCAVSMNSTALRKAGTKRRPNAVVIFGGQTCAYSWQGQPGDQGIFQIGLLFGANDDQSLEEIGSGSSLPHAVHQGHAPGHQRRTVRHSRRV